MLGWMILFALLAMFGLGEAAYQSPAPSPAFVAMSLVFSALFLVSLLVRALRRRA
jgi:hypothetical protein